jgi:hypothetical protein
MLAQRAFAIRAVGAVEHQEDRHAAPAALRSVGGEIGGGRQRVLARPARCARRRVDARAGLRMRRCRGRAESEC